MTPNRHWVGCRCSTIINPLYRVLNDAVSMAPRQELKLMPAE